MVIPLMNEPDEQFSGVDGTYKSSLEKLIHMRDLIPLKTTEYVWYDVVQSYEWLVSSETTSCSALEYSNKVFTQQSTCGIWLLCVFSYFVCDWQR